MVTGSTWKVVFQQCIGQSLEDRISITSAEADRVVGGGGGGGGELEVGGGEPSWRPLFGSNLGELKRSILESSLRQLSWRSITCLSLRATSENLF